MKEMTDQLLRSYCLVSLNNTIPFIDERMRSMRRLEETAKGLQCNRSQDTRLIRIEDDIEQNSNSSCINKTFGMFR